MRHSHQTRDTVRRGSESLSVPIATALVCFTVVRVPTGTPSRGWDVAVYVFAINQPSLPTPFYSVLVSISVFMVLSTVFHSINSPNNSPLSHSVLRVLILPYWSFYLYTFFMKVSLSPDIILCGSLGLKHRLTNYLPVVGQLLRVARGFWWKYPRLYGQVLSMFLSFSTHTVICSIPKPHGCHCGRCCYCSHLDFQYDLAVSV